MLRENYQKAFSKGLRENKTKAAGGKETPAGGKD